ncbi:MAG: Crp/Fnr family transcriptional regulator [Chloroflexota bacterium]
MPLQAICTLPLFRGLGTEEVQILARSFVREAFERGQTLFAQGDPAKRLYILIKGRVGIRFKPHDGDVVAVADIGPGGVFGWSAALSRPAYTSSAVATEASEVISISGEKLRHLCEAYPKTGVVILERLAEVIAERLNSTHAKVVDLLQEGVRTRRR